ATNKVISTRDVIFNKDTFFSRDIKDLKDNLLYTSTKEFTKLLESIALLELGPLQDVLLEGLAEDNPEFIVLVRLDVVLDKDFQNQDSENQGSGTEDSLDQDEDPQDLCI